MVKPSEVDLPVIFKKQLLFKSGQWNGWNISPQEVNNSVSNTKWDKFNSSLLYSHRDTEAEAWAGNVKNIFSNNGATYGDVEVWDQDAAIKLKHGKAPFAVSAGIAWPKQYDQPKEFFYRNFNLVSDPGVKDKDIFINFSSNGSDKDYNFANFNAMLMSDTLGSPGELNPLAKPTSKKMRVRTCKMCNQNYEDEEDSNEVVDFNKSKGTAHEISETKEEEKKEHANFEVKMGDKEFVEEHKNLVDVLKNGTPQEQKVEADKQEKELHEQHEKSESPSEEKKENDENNEKQEEMCNKANMGSESTSSGTIKDSQGTQDMMKDVIKKKEYSMVNLETKNTQGYVDEEATQKKSEPHNLITERRTQNNIAMTNISGIDTKEKKANFESEVPQPKVEEKKEDKKEESKVPVSEGVSPVNTTDYTKASPVMDDNFVDRVANRLSEKMIPVLKPAPMTTQEFGKGFKDPQEDALDRLAKQLVRN